MGSPTPGRGPNPVPTAGLGRAATESPGPGGGRWPPCAPRGLCPPAPQAPQVSSVRERMLWGGPGQEVG